MSSLHLNIKKKFNLQKAREIFAPDKISYNNNDGDDNDDNNDNDNNKYTHVLVQI